MPISTSLDSMKFIKFVERSALEVTSDTLYLSCHIDISLISKISIFICTKCSQKVQIEGKARTSTRAARAPMGNLGEMLVPRMRKRTNREKRERSGKIREKSNSAAGVIGPIMREPPAASETNSRPCSALRVMRNDFELMNYYNRCAVDERANEPVGYRHACTRMHVAMRLLQPANADATGEESRLRGDE